MSQEIWGGGCLHWATLNVLLSSRFLEKLDLAFPSKGQPKDTIGAVVVVGTILVVVKHQWAFRGEET